MASNNSRGIKKSFVPINETQRTIITRIQQCVSDSTFMEKYKMLFLNENYKMYTVVLEFLEGIRRTLHKNEKVMVSIGDIITIKKSIRNKSTAEKYGNINCVIELGPIGEEILNKGIDGFKDVLPDDNIMKGDMEYAQAIAKKELLDYGYGVNEFGTHDLYYISIIFLMYMIEVIKEYAENAKVNEDTFEVILGGYIRAGFARDETGYSLTFNPGEDMKKVVKSDGYTER